MDYITACAVIKDEHEYLREWVTYHRLMGITRFVLYDNGSKVPIQQTVHTLKNPDAITVISFPGRGRQMEAYTDCIARVSGKTRWLSLTDIDEYLVPVKAVHLVDVLRLFENYGALGVNWQTFGSSSHKEKPVGLQMDNFKLRAPVQWDVNKHVKVIVRPERAERSLSPHECSYKKGWSCVNERGQLISGPFSTPVSNERIQLNHYFTRSKKEYDVKMARGAADGTFKPPEFFGLVDKVATVKDETISRFSKNVKALL